uniref:Glial fibrillary acidic protein n=1 Tax=Anthurium amnicola TaxID=1678845 RepID=A0A1D1XXA2_9ARAE
MDEKNSGDRMFDNDYSELKNRQRQPTINGVNNSYDKLKSIDRTNDNQIGRALLTLGKYFYLIVIIVLVVLYSFENLTAYKKSSGALYGNLSAERIDKLGTSAINIYRAAFVNLEILLNNSDVITANDARVFFELSDHCEDAGKKILEFKWKADALIDSLSSELDNIVDLLNQKDFWDENYVGYMRKWIGVLRDDVPDLQEQLNRVTVVLEIIKEKSKQSQDCLTKVVKQYSLENITNYETWERAKEERRQVQYVLKLLKNLLPNLYEFVDFLKTYDKQLQDIDSMFDTIDIMYKLSKKALEKLMRATKNLEASHRNFIGRENRLGQKLKDQLSFEDDEKENSMNQDCKELKLKFKKSNDVYLNKLRIWSSHFINALEFHYSDGSVELLGIPGPSEPFDFEWDKDEKIKRFGYNFGSKIYGIEITTTKERSTGWRGSHNGHLVYPEMMGKEFNGLFVSYSKHICSIGVLEVEPEPYFDWLYGLLGSSKNPDIHTPDSA